MMEIGVISSSLEDYLEAIAEIIEQNDHAHAKDIADRLGVKMPSVTNALQSLAARGLIEYQSHAPVRLTTAGQEKAAVIRRRHEALRSFFADVLKLDLQEANDTGCRIEHVIDETVLSRLVVLSEAIAKREDCAALRSYLEHTLPSVCSESVEPPVTLDRLPFGAKGVVVSVDEDLRGVKKFADLGIVSGTLIQLEGKAPFGDLLRLRVMGCSLSIRACDAHHIKVKLTA